MLQADGVVDTIITQHSEEASFLWTQRTAVVGFPHVSLRQIAAHDIRLEAHIDGLRIAREVGWRACQAQIGSGAPGDLFAATILALESRHPERIETLFSLGEAVPDRGKSLTSALGWVSSQFLQGTVRDMLSSPSAYRRQASIAACTMHQVDPGVALDAAIASDEVALLGRSLRAAGECGRKDLLARCIVARKGQDPGCVFWAAWSAALLGDRGQAIDTLESIALLEGPFRVSALQLLLKAVEPRKAHDLLTRIAEDPGSIRLLLLGAGTAGDPSYVPWLIGQIENPKLARLAGESLSFITGLDLVHLNFRRGAPPDYQSGPNDEPDDPDVTSDPDDNLPWPHPERIAKWWDGNKSNFTNGTRYFIGKPVSREHCIHVLKEGFQRQRLAAAQYLCLLDPGTKLFPASAPAWRQRRWLEDL